MSTMQTGRWLLSEDFPILKGALLDSTKNPQHAKKSGKAPRMKNLILSTLPYARVWSVEHACMGCFVQWVVVSCLRKCECPRMKIIESLKHSKSLHIERFFDTFCPLCEFPI
jgi:hypothetical protein